MACCMLLACWRRKGWHIHMSGLCTPLLCSLLLLLLVVAAAGECWRRGLIWRFLLHVAFKGCCFGMPQIQQLCSMEVHLRLFLCIVHRYLSGATAASLGLAANKSREAAADKSALAAAQPVQRRRIFKSH